MVEHRYKRTKDISKKDSIMRWMVYNDRMECIGIVVADGYTEAFIVARNKYRNVDYIQEI